LGKEFTLGKNERLKHRKFIEQLFKEGKSFSIFPFRVFFLFMEELQAPLQAGFSASTRNFKKAVDRNFIKRITKEAYRLQKQELNAHLVRKQKKMAVFFVYTDKNLPVFAVVKKRVHLVLQKLTTFLHETDSAGS